MPKHEVNDGRVAFEATEKGQKKRLCTTVLRTSKQFLRHGVPSSVK